MIEETQGSPLTGIAPSEDPIRERCKAELFNPKELSWQDIRDDVLRIEQAHFGEKAFEEEEFVEAFENPETTAVLLRDPQTGKIVGFTYALPAEHSYSEEFYPERLTEVRTLGQRVAYIEDTAIDPAYVEHRLVGPLISTLEDALVDKGYGYLERDSAVENKYAANIAKVYGDRIVKSYPHESKFGDQVFFRIRLGSAPSE